jgi:hypothetical protein
VSLEEDLHNIALQEEASYLEVVICKDEEYITKGASVSAPLQWIDEEDVDSKFCFDYLKHKASSKRVPGLCKDGGSLEEDTSKIRLGCISKIFSPHICYMVELLRLNDCIVRSFLGTADRDRLDGDLSKDELFVSLTYMENGKPLSIEGSRQCGTL